MGVMLERVQFKFASIIGELCSEPDVLSQFAVWVDLRLAEYKLKGSISLDCSGETPDPVWLKGIKSALLAKELALRSQHRPPNFNRRKAPPLPLKSALGRSSTTTRDTTDTVGLTSTPINNRSAPSGESRLSPIVIKEEPDEVYPISLHVHNPESRKHPLTLDSHSDQPSPAKHERFMDPVSEDAPANESLISIIGLNDTTDKHDSAAQQTESVRDEIEMLMGQDLTDNSELVDQPFASNISSSSSLHAASTIGQVDSQNDIKQHWSKNSNFGTDPSQGQFSLPGSGSTQQNLSIDSGTRCRLRTFHRWIQAKQFREQRSIGQIPPVELDKYLTNFFTDVKTQNGTNFSKKSFYLLRSCLDRYLQSIKYPLSITHSREFISSQMAFRQRLQSSTNTAVQSLGSSTNDYVTYAAQNDSDNDIHEL